MTTDTTIGHAYLVNFGVWIRDYETGRSYAYDMRDMREHKLLRDTDADRFREQLDEQARCLYVEPMISESPAAPVPTAGARSA